MKYSLQAKNMMFKTGFMSACRRLWRSSNPAILRYHSIVEPAANFYSSPSIAIAPGEFEAHIRYLSERYNIISLDVVADCISEKRPFPERAVALTFDDGYRDNFNAYRIMKKYNVQGTFYVAAGCLGEGEPLWLFEVIYLIGNTQRSSISLGVKGKNVDISLASDSKKNLAIRKITEIIKSNNLEVREKVREQLGNQTADVADFHEKASQVMLTWEQIREMSENGMAIGGHTMTHINLPNAEYEDAVREINDCKRVIEEKTGKPVRHFSYPNSGNYDYYNDSIKEIVMRAGYSTSTTSVNGLADSNSDPFELSRIRVTPNLAEVMYQMECEPIVDGILERIRCC